MFGKKKEPKKRVIKQTVMYQNGIPNFKNDTVIEIKIDEPNGCITFSEGAKKENATAILKFEKIKSLEMGEKGSTIAGNSTAGAVIGGLVARTTGAIIGSTTGKKAANIPTLKILYQSNDGEKEINIYQCNYYSENSIQLVKAMIDKNISPLETETNIEL